MAEETCGAGPAGGDGSFMLAVWVVSAPLYHFRLACVVLGVTVGGGGGGGGGWAFLAHFWKW